MYILGIETSTRICGAALTQDQTLMVDYRLNLKNVHASRLLGIIESILKNAGLSVIDLAAIAISIGPGSFTGLRIGLSVAKGLALGGNIPIVAVPTLEALASCAPVRSGLVCPILKSRALEYYYAVYERDNYKDKLVQELQLVGRADLADTLPEGAILLGQTDDFRGDDSLMKKYIFAPEYTSLPTAFSIARLGYTKFTTGDFASFETLEPIYYQDFIAGKPKSLQV